MNMLLTVLGSRGDLNPFLIIGVNLKNRGHQVTIITSENYSHLVTSAGLNFISCYSAAEYNEVQNNPDLYDPRKGFAVLAKNMMLGTMRKLYQLISQFNPADTLLISSQFMLGARLANEKLGIPLVTLTLQPAAFWSIAEPAVNPEALFLPKLPFFIRKLIMNKVEKEYMDSVLSPELNCFREELHLPPIKKIYSSWSLSPQKIIGLFPEWYAKFAGDWPPQTQLTGFVSYDENASQLLPKEVINFLENGEAPLILTYGTANQQGQYFYKTFIEAGRRLNQRLLILTQYPNQLPNLQADRECYAAYLSLSTALSKSKGIIHHGGIGTLSQALATATPQLIVPFAHDQFDNAIRLEKIGAGISLISKKGYSIEKAVSALENLIESTELKPQCLMHSKKINFSEAENLTCQLIEKAKYNDQLD